MSHRKRAFTLIEVLVVVGIIAILAGMVLPVLLQAREKGREVSCRSGLRQLAAAALLYAEDYDEILVGTEGAEDEEYEMVWGDLLMPYVRTPKLLECASSPIGFEVSPPLAGFPSGLSSEWSYNYAINDVRDARDNHLGAAFAPLPAITHPSSTILFVDSWPFHPEEEDEESAHEVAWVLGARDAARRPNDDGNPRHHSGFNMVFVDGHVGRRKRDRIGRRYAGGTRDEEWLRSP